MTDDNEHRDHARRTRRGALAVTLGAVAWIAAVACIVARGWSA
ncbi:hypothetical protein ABT144_15050 [Streptomyces sp. NPDC002039]